MTTQWPVPPSCSAPTSSLGGASETPTSPMPSFIAGAARGRAAATFAPPSPGPGVAWSKGRSPSAVTSRSTSADNSVSSSPSISSALALARCDVPDPLFVKASFLGADTSEDTATIAAQSSLASEEDYRVEEQELLTHMPELPSGQTFASDGAVGYTEAGDPLACPLAGVPLWQELQMLAGCGGFPGAAQAYYAAAVEGTLGVPSLGSLGHKKNNCKPCAFFHKIGCSSGAECTFCHLCGPQALKQRKQERLKKIADARRQKAAKLAEAGAQEALLAAPAQSQAAPAAKSAEAGTQEAPLAAPAQSQAAPALARCK